MIRVKLSDYRDGWVIGNFIPSLMQTGEFEVAVKTYVAGDREPEHFQRTATEISIVIAGRCILGGEILVAGDIALIPPLESASFEALDDSVLVAIKTPSIPQDKIVGSMSE